MARELMAADLEASFPQLMPSLLEQLSAPTAAVARVSAPASAISRVSSWAGVPPTTVTISSYVPVTLNSSGDASGNAAITANETDYYGFVAPTTGTYRFAATTPTSNVDTVLGIFNSARQRIAYNDDISSSNTDSQLTVSLTAGQTYFFGITNYTGTPNGAYSWLVDGPAASAPGPGPGPGPTPVTDDAYEDNDTIGTATNLGTVTTAGTLSNLRMADSADWFRFTINANGTSSSSVSIAFTHAQGDLDMTLYNASGTQLASSAGTGNSETISLNGRAAGTYYVRVYGYNGAQNGNYSLTITPPSPAPAPGPTPGPAPGAGARRLYLNFDGVNLSRADLNRYDSGEWMTGLLDSLDSDRNGISVQPLFATRSDRTQIINQVISMVQADLSRFGITVVRHTGAAVENQYATTIFIGRSTLTGGAVHVAVDIDRGNRNRTDIAFVGEESFGSASNTAIAMADTVLHEAGHTFGLHHVRSGTALESMGLRYNTPQSSWVQDTAFLNQTFGPYHQGDSNQNSFQVMAATFGTTSSPAVSQPMTIAWQGTSSRPGVDCSLEYVQGLLGDHDHHEHELDEHDHHDHDNDHAAEPVGGSAASLLGGGIMTRRASEAARRNPVGPQPLQETTPASRTLLDLVHRLQLEEGDLNRSRTRTNSATVLELDEALAAWDQNLVRWN